MLVLFRTEAVTFVTPSLRPFSQQICPTPADDPETLLEPKKQNIDYLLCRYNASG